MSDKDDLQTGAAEPSSPKGGRRVRSILLGALIVVALAALVCVAISMISPGFFDGILNATPLTRDGVVLTFGDFEVTAQEYNHYVYPYKAQQVEAGNENYWKTNLEKNAELIATAEEFLTERYAQLAWAQELGVTATAEDIEKAVDEVRESYGGEEAFYDFLEQNYLTLELYNRLVGQSLTLDNLAAALQQDTAFTAVTQSDADAYVQQQGLLGAKHIFFLTQGLEDEQVAEKRALAQEVLAKLEAGEDFDSLMRTYTEDTGLLSYPNGYVFEEGAMVEAFTQAVKALQPGAHSGVVESELGFHIILRTQPGAKDMVLGLQSSTMTVEDLIVNERIDAKTAEYIASNGVKKGAGYAKLNVDQTKWDYPVVNP